jgi:hypothetical protein
MKKLKLGFQHTRLMVLFSKDDASRWFARAQALR